MTAVSFFREEIRANTETRTQVFSCEINEIFKNIYFEEHLQTTASVFSFKCWCKFKTSCHFHQNQQLIFQITQTFNIFKDWLKQIGVILIFAKIKLIFSFTNSNFNVSDMALISL